tara:strand:+ start:532 stop:663 length:132 start_codon:yes stop_codon:yes gene_type:complete
MENSGILIPPTREIFWPTHASAVSELKNGKTFIFIESPIDAGG